MTLAYELAIRLPKLQPEIIATQRARITNPDRQREFDYIARGTTPTPRSLTRSLRCFSNPPSAALSLGPLRY